MHYVHRRLGVVGTTGGVLFLLAFAGIADPDEQGNVSLLVLGVVFLAFGIPSLVRWLRTL